MEEDDETLREILETTSTIAMIGASPSPERPSYSVMSFLQSRGYRVLPVNPLCVGQLMLGERVYGALAEVPGPIEMVDVFRNSEAAGAVADDTIALAREKSVRTLWMQIGVRNDAAAARASAAGLRVVMDRCPKLEVERLGVRRRERCGGRR